MGPRPLESELKDKHDIVKRNINLALIEIARTGFNKNNSEEGKV